MVGIKSTISKSHPSEDNRPGPGFLRFFMMCTSYLRQVDIAVMDWVIRVYTKPFFLAKFLTVLLSLVWAVCLAISVAEFSEGRKVTKHFIYHGFSTVSAIILSLIFFASYLTALLGLIYKTSALLLPARMASLISSLLGIVMVAFYGDRGLYLPALATGLVTMTSYLYWFYLLVKITELLEEGEDLPDKLKLSWLQLVDRS